MDGPEPVWEISGQRTKNRQPHLVPLAPAVRDLILTRLKAGPLVFSTTGETPVSGFSRGKAQLDERITELRRAEGLPCPHILDVARSTSDDGDADERAAWDCAACG